MAGILSGCWLSPKGNDSSAQGTTLGTLERTSEEISDVRLRETGMYVGPILECTFEGTCNVRLRIPATYIRASLRRASENTSAPYVRERST